MASWNQSNMQTSVIETVALIVVIVLGFWFFVRPQMSVLHTEQQNRDTAVAEQKQIDQDKRTLSDLTARLKRSKDDITLVDEALPLQDRPSQVEFLLDDLVTASGMKTTDLSFQPP